MTRLTDPAAPSVPTAKAARPPAFAIKMPVRHTLPLVVASPHSGRHYPPEFLAQTRLPLDDLRRTEDGDLDRLTARVPSLGAPVISGLYARSYLDLNREPYELDPAMFADALPAEANTGSFRVAYGLGTVPRIGAEGEDIYAGKLAVADALRRVERVHRPYHRALAALVAVTLDRFGFCILLDCHSMPRSSVDGIGRDGRRVEMVLGDLHGSAADPAVTRRAERSLLEAGRTVRRNMPFAGGYTTQHYGQPADGVHALQLEIRRDLYMDEARLAPNAGWAAIERDLLELVRALGRLTLEREVRRPLGRTVRAGLSA